MMQDILKGLMSKSLSKDVKEIVGKSIQNA
jgi:hypothetical protein